MVTSNNAAAAIEPNSRKPVLQRTALASARRAGAPGAITIAANAARPIATARGIDALI